MEQENKENLPLENKRKGLSFDPDDYLILMQIGQGNFSEVFMVEHKETKVIYAMKMFNKMRVEQLKKQQDVLIEKHVMEKITKHANIIGYNGSNKDEYINGGELWKKCIYYGLPSKKLIKYYLRQILEGVKHLHDFNIIHRDLKPENIMVTKDEKICKIIDFGSCKDIDGTSFDKQFEEKPEDNKNKRRKPTFKNFVGTPNFMAPECVHNKDTTLKTDIWSLGCVLYQLICGFPPFRGKSDYLIFLKSTEAKYDYPEEIFNEEEKDFINKCIQLDSINRPTIDDLLNHYLVKETNSKKYPIADLKELSYRTVIQKIVNEFENVSTITERLKAINDEEINERHNYEEEDKKEVNLLRNEEKMKLQSEFDQRKNVLENKIQEIIACIEKNCENNKETLIKQFNHFEKQIKHHLFSIDY